MTALFPNLAERVPMSRACAQPSADTFEMPPVAALLDRWLLGRTVVVDPFARNGRRGTLRNDLNPETRAEHHMDAVAFADFVLAEGIEADAILFDPPYSLRQVIECYDGIGRKMTRAESQDGGFGAVKDRLGRALRDDGIALSFGWNSVGFGRSRGFELAEILLVSHGGAHNDTICTVERKIR